jgi:HSP20 family protein
MRWLQRTATISRHHRDTTNNINFQAKGSATMTLLPIKRREMPINELARAQSEMQDMMRSLFGNRDMPIAWQSVAWPAIDIAEQEHEYVVKAEVPGCKIEDIELSVSSNILTIRGEKKQEQEVKEKGYYHVERTFGSFRRDLSLAGDVDISKIDAKCKNGVLTVTLPKTEKAKTAKIKVKG